MSLDRVLLPTNVKPMLYNIHLTPDFETFKFAGVQTIDVEIVESTTTVMTNVLDIVVCILALTDYLGF